MGMPNFTQANDSYTANFDISQVNSGTFKTGFYLSKLQLRKLNLQWIDFEINLQIRQLIKKY